MRVTEQLRPQRWTWRFPKSREEAAISYKTATFPSRRRERGLSMMSV
jgi:hypothetical protein